MTPRTVHYTFGNHMHWVDMEWLWGYHVLPGSVADMLAWCEATGARGCANFDGIGYEKMAAEAPEALADLRAAVAQGRIEPVGCSYGQPYGLFHGGESNVRQRVFGTRAVRRLLGVWPRAFWEEEFDWFPQLPQMLRGAGMQFASLFFQWTWHTPEVPREDVPAVLWEAPDGSSLVTATRNALNLHQWPEDMDATLDSLSTLDTQHSTLPLVQQWIELMPSPDWMCRSEVLLPAMRRLLADPRLQIKFGTLTEYLSELDPASLPTRRYTPDQMWHGMTLGKNGDGMRRRSRAGEALLLTAEALATAAGRLGRPYAQWDAYPTWELEEAWRELLSAQHHDNDECEGLCGHVGVFSYERSASLAGHVRDRTLDLLAGRVPGPDHGLLVFNPLGWTRDDTVRHPVTGEPLVVRNVPPMGWATVGPETWESKARGWTGVPDPGESRGMRCQVGELRAEVDERGRLALVASPDWPEGVLAAPALELEGVWGGERRCLEFATTVIDPFVGDAVVHFQHPAGGRVEAWVKLPSDTPCVDVTIKAFDLPRPDPGLNAALAMRLAIPGGPPRLVVDHPYGESEVEGTSHGVRKYPEGDWMTSPQWFETVEGAFHCLSRVDLLAPDGRGLLAVHDGSQQWFRDGDGVKVLLCAYDPWDEGFFVGTFEAAFRLVPHGGLSPVRRRRLAQEFLRPVEAVPTSPGGDAPTEFSLVGCEARSTALEALHRETEDAGRHTEGYAGTGMGYPLVARLVEWNGEADEAVLEWAGTVAAAFKTDLLGAALEPLAVDGSRVRVSMRPHEIATVYVDLVEARKQSRDLDAKRAVWATVHRR